MSDTKDKPEAEKTFQLKAIEQQMLDVLQQQYFSLLSNFLSFVAIERFAYQVTPNTQFKIADDKASVTISELEQPPAAPNAEQTPEQPKDEVSVA